MEHTSQPKGQRQVDKAPAFLQWKEPVQSRQFDFIPLRAEPGDQIRHHGIQHDRKPDDGLDIHGVLFSFRLRVIRAIEAFDDALLPVGQLDLHALQASGFPA